MRLLSRKLVPAVGREANAKSAIEWGLRARRENVQLLVHARCAGERWMPHRATLVSCMYLSLLQHPISAATHTYKARVFQDQRVAAYRIRCGLRSRLSGHVTRNQKSSNPELSTLELNHLTLKATVSILLCRGRVPLCLWSLCSAAHRPSFLCSLSAP